MNIEVKNGSVLKDGEHVGEVDDKGEFSPIDSLHHKTRESVEKFLTESKEEKPKSKKSDEPKRTELGDIDPALIEWREKNWSKSEFNHLYPESRLRQIRG